FIDFTEEKPYPDGMTVDRDGDLWIAFPIGGFVGRFSAAGEEKQRIPMPVRMVTSVAFGGESLDQLYITSGNELGEMEWNQDLAGALLRIDRPATGKPEFRSRVGL